MEKEIKILEVNRKKIEKTLQDLGAKKMFEGEIHDVYYDYKNSTMDAQDRVFRIRKKGTEHLYTIKKKEKNDNYKIAHEHEMKITDVESFRRVLEKYGLKKVREKKKLRVAYSIDDVHFELDKYTGIPWLLEIEVSSYLSMKYWIEKLGLQDNTQKRFGSRGLFRYYTEKKKKKVEKKLKKLTKK